MKSSNKAIITIYYINIEDVSWNEISSMLNIVSKQEKQKILEMQREKDRCLSLVGKLLLLYFLNQNSTQKVNRLPKLEYTSYGKPQWENISSFFNITHSENMVACAYGYDKNIGIDIELIKNYNIDMFAEILTLKEYEQLKKSNNIVKLIQIWTIKEAVLKADGRGFYADPQKIVIQGNKVHFENRILSIQSKTIRDQYLISIASESDSRVFYREINIKDLIFMLTCLQN